MWTSSCAFRSKARPYITGDVIVVAEREQPAGCSVARAGRVCPAAKAFVQHRPVPP